MKSGARIPMKKRTGLPHSLRTLFWDYRFSDLTWEQDRDLIIGSILVMDKSKPH